MNIDTYQQFTALCELRSAIPRQMDTAVLSWLRNSAAAGTFQVFKDGIGRPVGYVVWADVNRESALRLAQLKQIPRYAHEWREGRITLILDFLMTKRGSLSVRQALRQFLRGRRALAFMRRGRPHFYIKRGALFERLRDTPVPATKTPEAQTAPKAAMRVDFGFPNSALGYPMGVCADDISSKLDPLPSGPRRYPTRRQTQGPYYRAQSPCRSDLREANIVGRHMTLIGHVVDIRGVPIVGAVLDFWQPDGNGSYDNEGFRLRGHLYTDRLGRYQLETVVPHCYEQELEQVVLYRTAHIHVKLQGPNTALLTTQIYFPHVAAENEQDLIFDRSLTASPCGTNGLYRFDFVLTGLDRP